MTSTETGLEYIIYCRKSTDENSGMQTQSIPDQIQKCVEYAEKNGLRLKMKSKDFPFESEKEIAKENNDPDPMNRKIFKDTRHLFIVKEQETAKIPYKRKKRRKIIQMIDSGKIEGILSYSPDRQARNILEGGELINFVDNEQVDLKYTNFHFDPNASGKMMLGIRFVLSKQYSDKLGEDISRGNQSAFLRGKAIGKKKYGYFINDDGYHQPEGKNFQLMQKAFHLKIYDHKSDEYIASFLNKNGFEKVDGLAVNPKRLGVIRKDPFYYGVSIREKAGLTVDLRETNKRYEHMISEEEYYILQDRFLKRTANTRGREFVEEYSDIKILPDKILKNPEGYGLAFYITPKKRFEKKIDVLKKTNPKASWVDVVSLYQTRFRLVNKKSKDDGLEITGDLIEKAVSTLLKSIEIDEKSYNAYIRYSQGIMEDNIIKNNQETSRLTLILNRKKSERTLLVQRCLGQHFDKVEKEVYEKRMKQFEEEIKILHSDIESISDRERDEMIEQVSLVDLLRNMSSRFDNGTIVQKREIISLLFSNIVVNNKKRLTLEVKPGLQYLFSGELEVMGFEPMSESHIVQRLPS